MPADFPAFAMGGRKRKPHIQLSENEPNVVSLPDGRKLHVLVENPSVRKSARKPLTSEQVRDRYFLAALVMFVFIAVCLVCTLLATLDGF